MLRVFAQNCVYSRTVCKIIILLIFLAALSSKMSIPMLILQFICNIASFSEEFLSRFQDFRKLKSLLALYNNPMHGNAATQPS